MNKNAGHFLELWGVFATKSCLASDRGPKKDTLFPKFSHVLPTQNSKSCSLPLMYALT